MCPKFRTNPVLKHTKCHISTNLSNFLKVCFQYCRKLFALALTNRRFAEKNQLSGNTDHEYLPEGSTVNQTYYIEVLKRLRDAIRRKRPELWRSGDWFFHHDNAPAHSALRTREFLAKHSITVLPHPPYSPDLAPCDFFMFLMLKRSLKGRRFETISEIKANAT